MKAIILAGGGGTRLFPLSRQSFPKQFLEIEKDVSLLEATVRRFLPIVPASDIVVVTNEAYQYHVQNELCACRASAASVVLEPMGRNTAPAIALAMKFCQEKLSIKETEPILVAPADHVVGDEASFQASIAQAIKLASEGALVTFGVKPDKAETGYGYIESAEAAGGVCRVQSFKEKPSKEVAEKYLRAGTYFWNSGMFVFTYAFMARQFSLYQPQLAAALTKSYAEMADDFAALPNISIDYAVAEKCREAYVVPLTSYWNDIGSWDAIYDILPKDEARNAVRGDCMTVNCEDSLFWGRDRLIVGIGLKDILLVETDDVIVAAQKGESQKVKEVVERLKAAHRKEALEHTTVYRRWGSYTLLGEGNNYRMRKLRVNPNAGLQAHMHYHRAEHWVVLAGTARVIIDGREIWLHENESAFVPQTTKHKLENQGKIPLEIIEVQNGGYIAEDDILSFDE